MAENPGSPMNTSESDPGIDQRDHGKKSPRIIVQAGAYKMRAWEETGLEGLKNATIEGYADLKNGGRAVDAAEKAVRILENNENFNAGPGSVTNKNGEVECDAMIMDGHTMKTGAVVAVRHFRNPVKLSRLVMDRTPHCALCADGALEFARDNNFPTLEDPKELIEKSRDLNAHQNFEDFLKINFTGEPITEKTSIVNKTKCPKLAADQPKIYGNDSVSAVAMDTDGHFACAISTGGIPGKMKGRIGDSPLVGCGGYANEFGAATSSGHGEQIMKMTLAREVVYNMERDQNAQTSAQNAVKRMEDRVQGYGGVIAIDQHGNFGKAFNTAAMSWASIGDDVLKYGTKQDEFETEHIA